MRTRFLLLAMFLFICGITQAQSLPSTIKVFIDCSNSGQCYQDFIRQEIPIVDFVRDRLDADVHVVVTTQYNTTSSARYSLNFIGRNQYNRLTDTLEYTVPPAASDDLQRNLFSSNIKLGLIPYLNRTAQRDQLTIQFNKRDSSEKSSKEKDPWRAWVFQFSASGNVNGNQNYFSGNGYFSISADKETDNLRTNVYLTNSEQIQKYRDAGTTYTYKFLDHSIGFKHIKKLNEHVGLGCEVGANNSLYSNLKYEIGVNARAEYSFFPYKKFNTLRWIIVYTGGALYNRYYDTTIYFKTKETIYEQNIGSIFSYIQPYGAINLGVFWNNYFNDFQKRFNLCLVGRLCICTRPDQYPQGRYRFKSNTGEASGTIIELQFQYGYRA